jgi:hypothetical protein
LLSASIFLSSSIHLSPSLSLSLSSLCARSLPPFIAHCRSSALSLSLSFSLVEWSLECHRVTETRGPIRRRSALRRWRSKGCPAHRQGAAVGLSNEQTFQARRRPAQNRLLVLLFIYSFIIKQIGVFRAATMCATIVYQNHKGAVPRFKPWASSLRFNGGDIRVVDGIQEDETRMARGRRGTDIVGAKLDLRGKLPNSARDGDACTEWPFLRVPCCRCWPRREPPRPPRCSPGPTPDPQSENSERVQG